MTNAQKRAFFVCSSQVRVKRWREKEKKSFFSFLFVPKKNGGIKLNLKCAQPAHFFLFLRDEKKVAYEVNSHIKVNLHFVKLQQGI